MMLRFTVALFALLALACAKPTDEDTGSSTPDGHALHPTFSNVRASCTGDDSSQYDIFALLDSDAAAVWVDATMGGETLGTVDLVADTTTRQKDWVVIAEPADFGHNACADVADDVTLNYWLDTEGDGDPDGSTDLTGL